MKKVQLHRAFGEWPTNQFKALSAKEQAEFMNAIRAIPGQADLAQSAKFQMERFSSKSKYYSNGGEFLPLNVWEKRGFDVELIRKNSAPADKMHHSVLGEVYRVAILSSGSRGEEGDRTTHMVKTRRDSDSEDSDMSLGKLARKREQKANAKVKKAAIKKRKAERKAEMEEKSARKASEKAAAAEQKAQDIAKKRRLAEAGKVEEKLTNIVAANKATMAQPGTLLLPSNVIDQAREIFGKVEATLKIAQLVIEGTAGEQSVPDMKVVKEQAQDAKKAEAMLTSMIASMVRFQNRNAEATE